MANNGQREGAMSGKTEVQRQTDNDQRAREFLDIVKARQERMGITEGEALAATIYILFMDYTEARYVGDRTFTSEFKSRRGGIKSE